MKCHMAAYISHPEAYVQNFIQLVDIISWMGQNKNTLRIPRRQQLLSHYLDSPCFSGPDHAGNADIIDKVGGGKDNIIQFIALHP